MKTDFIFYVLISSAYFVVLSFIVGMYFLPKCYSANVTVSLSEDVCRFFKNGEIVRDPKSCTDTLICQDGKSMPHTIKCSNGQIVSLSSMKCETPKTADPYCTPSCAKATTKWIADNKNCRQWHECKNKTLGQTGFCPMGQMFIEKEQRCIYDNGGKCDKTFDICNVAKQSTTKQSTKIWDEINCHKYFVCNSKRAIEEKSCDVGLYYDARLGECIPKAQVNCYKHPTPDFACGNQKLAIRNRFVRDRATCRGFFFCKSYPVKKDGNWWNYDPDKYPIWGQCNINQFFDEETQYCLEQYNVKCDEDRCDGHMSGKVLSEEPGCQHYLECENGYTTKLKKCDDNKYFDPVTETCVDRKITYPICV